MNQTDETANDATEYYLPAVTATAVTGRIQRVVAALLGPRAGPPARDPRSSQ